MDYQQIRVFNEFLDEKWNEMDSNEVGQKTVTGQITFTLKLRIDLGKYIRMVLIVGAEQNVNAVNLACRIEGIMMQFGRWK